jgi:glycosyltransferase involved in cell wall biosynthesis
MPLLKRLTHIASEFLPIKTYRHELKQTPDGKTFSIDGPRWLRPRKGEFLLRGWCFNEKRSIKSIRIKTRQGTQVARYGIERQDLLEAFNSQNERILYSGFEVPLKVPRGSTPFELQYQYEGGDWDTLICETLIRPRLKAFDQENSNLAKSPYGKWVKKHDTLSERDHDGIRQYIKILPKKPLISVVVPTYNTSVKLLDLMVKSIRDQLYENWELCIADDHSTLKSTRKRLQYWAQRDERIRVHFRETNGHISECTNSAIEMVRGDYIALVDHDDEIPAHALFYVALEIVRHPTAQIIYSDEDKITPDGYRLDPYFKPDFGPDLLCSHNFVSHLGVYKTELIRKIGGFRKDFVGSQDWDLVLRCLDHVEHSEIRHIPRILYHWRLAKGSTSASVGNKDYAVTAGRRALTEYLEKHEPTGSVEDGPTAGSLRIRYSTPGDPLVSIIILTKNNAEILDRCVESILKKTGYRNFELLIVDNNSDEVSAIDLLANLNKKTEVTVLDNPVPFNFSELNNWAAQKAKGEVLVFLNNDMEVIEGDWLKELTSHALRDGVGPVGTKLLFPDDYVQHAGIIMGIAGTAGHAFKFLHRQNPGQIGRAGIIQNYSAVTAACMAIRSSTFHSLGGFDAVNLGIAYNDADLCLRAWEKGYRTVYTPYALLYHHESASRGLENSTEKKLRWRKEADYLLNKWMPVIQNDPFYNPALTLVKENFELANPPRYECPWRSYIKTDAGLLDTLYFQLPWTPKIKAELTEAQLWLQVNEITVIFGVIAPKGSTIHIRKDGLDLIYLEYNDAPPLYEGSDKETVLNLSTTFDSEPKDAIITVEVTTEGSTKTHTPFQIRSGDIRPDKLKRPILHNVDGIIAPPDLSNRIVIGWCFALNPLLIREIQIRLDETPLVLEYPLKREDVSSVYIDQGDAQKCGFECELPPNRHDGTFTIECKINSESWIQICQMSLKSLKEIKTRPNINALPETQTFDTQPLFNVETIFVEQQKKLKTRIRGWVFLKDGPAISKVRMLYRDKTLLCRYGMQREDVQQEFPDQLTAAQSGFELQVEDIPGNPNLRFEFKIEGGVWIEFDQRKAAQIHYTFYTERKIPSSKSGVHSNVENAQIGRRYGHQFMMTGWCFRIDGEPIKDIRIRTGKSKFPGKIGIERKDVFSENGSTHTNSLASGFEIPLDNIPRNSKLKFEYKTDNGKWMLFAIEDFSRFPVSHYASQSEEKRNFNKWLEDYDHLISIQPDQVASYQSEFKKSPKISVIMPVYNTPEIYLRKAIQSVIDQYYDHWELCIADDASTQDHVWKILTEFASQDSRIKIMQRDTNGHICRASNSALSLATGEWCAFLDHDDAYPKDALLRTVVYINRFPNAGLFYSDEDKLDKNDRRHDPYFKPDWNPELLEGQNFLCHLTVTKLALVNEVGKFQPGLEGSQDWDLFLKITERLDHDQVIHMPYLLYHWRAIEGSTALALDEKGYIRESSLNTLKGHCKRTNPDVEILPIAHGHWRLKYPVPETEPLVSIIIPTKDQSAILGSCIESIRNQTTYPNYEIIVVDNNSEEDSTTQLFKELKTLGIEVLSYPNPFNFSAINNFAAKHANGDYLAFLNNDMSIIDGDWLNEMISHACKPHVGAVGAKLYYPEDCVQHAGVILGINGVAGHCFKYAARGEPGQRNRLNLTQQFSAITAACLVVEKEIFEEVNGFEEQHLGVAFNDIDLCLRIREAGYVNIWTPHAQLYHHESLSRGDDNDQSKKTRVDNEIDYMRKRWGEQLRYDPTYNPNLTLEFEDFSLAWPPRLPKA